MKMQFGIAPTGHYHIQKHKRDGSLVWETEFDNIVLDVGWNEMMDRLNCGGYSQAPQPKYLYLGTGTTEPLVTDLGLEAVSATLPGKARSSHSPSGSSLTAEAEPVVVLNQTFVYGEGEAEGVWTELGLAYDTAYSLPYNRSLIRDANGNPISLTILSDEYLTVYVKLKLYIVEPTNNTGAIDYNGASHTYSYNLTSWLISHNPQWNESCNPWYSGLPRTFVCAPTQVTLAYLGNLLFESANPTVHGPGSEITFSSFSFETSTGATTRPVITGSISPSIVIPSDHKVTIQPHSIQWARTAVPTA